jgi:hypothetical protein
MIQEGTGVTAVELLIDILHGQRCRCLHDSSPEKSMSSLLLFYARVLSSELPFSDRTTALANGMPGLMQVVKQ